MNEFAAAAANQELRELAFLAVELLEDREAVELKDPEAVDLDWRQPDSWTWPGSVRRWKETDEADPNPGGLARRPGGGRMGRADLVRVGPAGDLVQVRPDPHQLAGALSLHLGVRHGPRAHPANRPAHQIRQR